MATNLEQIIGEHEKKLSQHDKELIRLNDIFLEIKKDLTENMTRMDESNRYLREQNQSIFSAVISGNEKSEERKHEINLLNKTNLWKAIFGIGASAGAVVALIAEAFRILGGK